MRDLSTKSISNESKDGVEDEVEDTRERENSKRDSFIDIDGDSFYQVTNPSSLTHPDRSSGKYSNAVFDAEKKKDLVDVRTDQAGLSISTSLHRVSEDDWREEFKAVWKMECVFI